MEKIASFTIDHLRLLPGLYVSRKDREGDVTVTTFDLRFTAPNREPAVEQPALHTIEHLGATYLRNCEIKDKVVYFGPMGCRTGFYFIVRDAVTPQQAIDLTRDALAFCAAFEGEIPGASEKECGNWRDHDLAGAKREAAAMCDVLQNWTPDKLAYPTK